MLKIDIYLRKSRADEELEKKLGEGETLARHRRALLKLAKEKNYSVVNIHEELVSGEELFFRPAMLELLKDVEKGICDAVLVMDIQRLGRGDMEEQGLILKTFKKANVRIITPQKTYDLNNEFDEEYSEFEAFMSRKEYKMITRRMQGGRVRSVEEGNYVATRPPYGYQVQRIDKRTRVLVPDPEQSNVIKMIFDWYVNKNMGCGKIASELNILGIKSYTGKLWERTTITSFIKNPVYIGKLVWKKKCIKKSKTPGKSKDTYTRDKSEWIIVEGKHEPIIDIDTYNKAQELLAGKYHVPYQIENGVVNPLAGLVICGVCGSKMKRRPYKGKEAHLICEKKCGVKSNKFSSVENAVINGLNEYLRKIGVKVSDDYLTDNKQAIDVLESNISGLENELSVLESQRLKAFDFLEQGIYDVSVFTERSSILAEKILQVKSSIQECESKIKNLKSKQVITNQTIKDIKKIFDAYTQIDEPKDKNILLKSLLEKVVYYKDKSQKSDDFKIELHHKLLGTIDL